MSYKGHIIASKPQNALWSYRYPISKDVYIDRYTVTIVEPEIEQVIIRRIEYNFDFFNMIKNARQVDTNRYEATYKETKFNIILEEKIIKSISYLDEFENRVDIVFKDQKQNESIDKNLFLPEYPLEFDIIRD